MTPYELFYGCTVADLEKFGQEFSTCHSAFRLELLEKYTEETEAEYLEAYQAGRESCPAEFNAEWLSILQAASKRDATFRRARLIPDSGVSPYIKFEMDWGYRRSLDSGEEIRTISTLVLSQLVVIAGIAVDFWLFDEVRCYLVIYDADGRFMGAMLVSKADTPRFVETSKLAWDRSEAIEWR